MAENTQKKQGNLDKSIDLGMDNFGRFVKARWLWLILVSAILWWFAVYIVPQLTPPTPGSIFGTITQFFFYGSIIAFQYILLFWFLGRPRLYWVMPGETGVTFDDYKGNPEVLESARRIVKLLQGVQGFQKMGGHPIRGLLLAGPPGTGKSYLAQCISSEADVPFAYASAASFRAMFIGMDVLMIRNLYRKARRLARQYGACVIFMDEIDAIATSRTAGGANRPFGGGMMGLFGGGSGGLNQLLMEMDPPPIETGWLKKILRIVGMYHGRVQSQPVLTIGATNIPDTLDPALLRPGRFDRKLHIDPPTDKYRGEVIEYYLNKVAHEPNISIRALIGRLVDTTPVEIKNIINEAVISAHFDGRDKVTYRDITEAQDLQDFGLRQTSDLTPIERRRLAYHETGHTVAMYYLMERHFPAYVTLHRRDTVGGEAFAAPRPRETVKTQSREEVLVGIQVSVASRAAEELFLDVRLNGVGGDFWSATQDAARYVGQWGMDGTITSYAGLGGFDQAMMIPVFRDRVEAVLQSQLNAVKRLFQEHSEAVMAVAEALIERDELVEEEIEQLIKEADARRVTRVVVSDFEQILGNGKNGGYALSGGRSNGSTGNGRLIDAPKVDSQPQPFSDVQAQTSDMQVPPTDEGPLFLMDE